MYDSRFMSGTGMVMAVALFIGLLLLPFLPGAPDSAPAPKAPDPPVEASEPEASEPEASEPEASEPEASAATEILSAPYTRAFKPWKLTDFRELYVEGRLMAIFDEEGYPLWVAEGAAQEDLVWAVNRIQEELREK